MGARCRERERECVSSLWREVEVAAFATAPRQANPVTATAGDAAATAMIRASKVTTGAAAAILGLGLAATWALPPTPPAPANPTAGPDTAARPARRRRRQTA